MMSDHPYDDPNFAASQGDPDPREDDSTDAGGWHSAAEEPAGAEDQEAAGGGWHTPDEPEPSEGDTGWHAPEVSPEPESEEQGELPGGWYTPGPATEPGTDYEATTEGGWYVPASSQAAELLDGVDRTIYPVSQAVEAETGAEEDAVLGADEALDDDFGLEEDRVLGLDAEEDLSVQAVAPEAGEAAPPLEASDAAQVAAEMAARLAGEIPAPSAESVPADTFFPQAEEDPAAVAAAKAAELAGEVSQPAEPAAHTEGIDRLVSRFDNVEAQVARLRAMYRRGEITREALQAELKKLMILDDQGMWWMVGLESNTWYRFENGQWVEAPRPRLVGAEAVDVPAPQAEDYLQDTQQNISLDEYNMPVMHQVPQADPEATMVSPSAVSFDRLPGQEPTIPSPAVGAQAAPGVEAQPDYGAAYRSAEESELFRKAQLDRRRRQRSLFLRVVVGGLFALLGVTLILILASVLFYTSRVNRYNDRIAALAEVAGQFQTTRVYDKNGNLLSQINDPTGGTRISVPLDQISPYLLHAVISTEDERFYENPGWDPFAILRAAVQNLQSGTIVSGASTITQQLAKALVLEPERRTEVSYGRKLDEAIIAAEIGRRYTKNEILELYLNEIYFGNLAYGAEAAAEIYFGVGARDLNLPQAALLAGIVQAPATYDPVTNRETAFQRMNAVLEKMMERGCVQFQHEPYLTQGPFCVTQADVAAAVVQKAEVEIREYTLPENTVRYPHFVNFVAQQLEENYGLSDIYRAGFNVYTTIDPELQDFAQQVAREEVAALNSQGRGGNNASVVVMDPRDGRILAMVGSVDYNNEQIGGQVNVAFTPQQPGSSIKPILYVAALQGNAQGQYWTPATVIWDTRTCWGGYCPPNYDGVFHGPQSLRSALANSYNVPAVKTLDFVGVDRFAQTAQAMGLTFPGNTPQEAGLPGALGAFDVRLYDMVVAYGVLANGGKLVQPYAITRILDNDGNEIPIPARPEPQQVIQPEHAYLITHILADDVARSAAFGRNSLLNIPNYSVAVKTGTTNDNRDNWTIGYAPNVVVGVWHGNTDNSPMRGTSGLSGAGPIWNRVIQAALSREAPQQFPIPPNVGTIEVCADSGTQPSAECVNRRQELVVTTQLPPGPENDIYKRVRVNTLTRQVANDFCPRFNEERMFLNISDPTAFEWINNTSAGQNWATERGLELPVLPVPTEACNPNTQQPIITMDWPVPNAEVQGVVEVQGRVLVFNFNRYQLEYGIGTDPEEFQLVDGPYQIQHNVSEFLGRWDVSMLPNGPYTLRLKVITNDGGYADLDQVVFVNNPIMTPTPIASPTVAIITQTIPPIIVTQTPTQGFPTIQPATSTPFIVTATPPVVFTAPPPGATQLPAFDINFAIPVIYGAEATGIINDSSLAVFYRFDGQAGDIIYLTADATAGDLDTMVFVMDSMGNVLAENDDGEIGTNSELQYTLPASGTYVIAVSRFDLQNGVTSGEYRMRLTKLN
ncbi:MAG: hypothetical protein Kow0077_21050 [Anaerolineae bacterium]